MVDFTVLVVTHNRAGMLRDTLHALARQTYAGTWEVLVVDNNSTDHTRALTETIRADDPVAVRYLFEGRPGKYRAMNAGIDASSGRWIAATDDDALPEPDWLTHAANGFSEYSCDFVGGPVYPIFRAAVPDWLDRRGAIAGKVLGLQNHGVRPREYGRDGVSWPLGVNIAYRREAFGLAGVFDPQLGRVAGTLRNQSQREWHLRARAAGLHGMYLPQMIVRHIVDAPRLTRRYFYRWFYWHGISRAILYRTAGVHMLEPEGSTTHLSERHLLWVPTSLWRDGARAVVSAARRHLRGDRRSAFEYELLLCFCAGVVRQRVRDRNASVTPAPGSTSCDATRHNPDRWRRSA
jgi:glycosyltransferase involved in cell wall biosynthesis